MLIATFLVGSFQNLKILSVRKRKLPIQQKNLNNRSIYSKLIQNSTVNCSSVLDKKIFLCALFSVYFTTKSSKYSWQFFLSLSCKRVFKSTYMQLSHIFSSAFYCECFVCQCKRWKHRQSGISAEKKMNSYFFREKNGIKDWNDDNGMKFKKNNSNTTPSYNFILYFD